MADEIILKKANSIDELLEALNIGDVDSVRKAKTRALDLARVAKEARKAADKATKNNKEDLAQKLNLKADELETMAREVFSDENSNESEEKEDSKDKKDSDTKNTDSENDESDENSEDQQSNEQQASDQQSNNAQNNDQESDDQQSSDQESSDDQQSSNKSKNNKVDNNSESELSDDGDASQNDKDSDNNNNKQNSDKNQNKNSSKQNAEDEEGQEKDDDTSAENTEDSESDGEGDKESENKEEGKNQNSEESEESEESSSNSEESSENSDSEENDEDDTDEGDDEPVKNPFADDEDNPQLPGSEGGKEPRDANLEDIYKIINELSGEARRGAIDSLKNILRERSRTLTESKHLRDLSDDEFNDIINSALDLIDQASQVDRIDVDDVKNKIGKWADSPKALQDLEAEDNIDLKKDYQKKKAREEENSKYRNYPTISDFEINFYNTIKSQVDNVLQDFQSYSEVNAEYEDEDIIMKADVERELPEEAIPVIDFYFDVSGSWTDHPDAIDIGKRAVATVQEFADRGEIKLNIWYFGNDISPNMHAPGVWGAGTHAWSKILTQIKADEATNIVLMTDGDMAGQAATQGRTAVVDGSVWFIWSLYDYARGSSKIIEHLIGRSDGGRPGQYAFGTGGYVVPYGEPGNQ